jgi:hypothetical protein
MDPRVTLLKEFYEGLPTDRAKVETHAHGFAYLEELLLGGARLEYGELTLSATLHKYKLVNLTERRMDELLLAHVEKRLNLCRYFDDRANWTFCFNLDNNHRTDNTAIIPEMALAIRLLREGLERAGCAPLILASGRGYHAWGRLDAPVENDRLHAFMLRHAVETAAGIHFAGLDRHKVKFNFYPDPRTQDTVSLRLFGSDHAKNRLFSRVLTPDGLLDEAASWKYFENHRRTGTMAARKIAP